MAAPIADDYDPHLTRVDMLAHPTNNLETLFHLIKGCLGTGVLCMPEAFKFAGMINGIISSFIIAVFCTYCLHVLIKGQYVLCKKRKVGLLIYSETMRVACEVGPDWCKNLGNVAAGMVDSFLIFYQTGCCCVYLVFIGSNVKYVADIYTPKELALYIYMLALIIPILLIMFVRNLKLLAPFSIVADIIAFITFAVVFYYICQNLNDKFTDRPAVGRFVDYPLFFGTLLFSLQSVPIVVAVENNMATPKVFRAPFGPLNVGFALLTIMYVLVALLGYWRYGEEIQPTITMNFPVKDILAQVIILGYCCAIYVSYALNAYVPLDILWNTYFVKKLEANEAGDGKKLALEYLMRFCFTILTFLLATTIPLLGLIIALIGSVCLSALGIIFPAFIDIAANWEEEKSRPGTVVFWKDMLLLVIGFFGMFSGAYSSIRAMVEELSKLYVEKT